MLSVSMTWRGVAWLSVFGHLELPVGEPVGLAVGTPFVHFIHRRSQHVRVMLRVLSHLLGVFFSCDHVECPSAVEFGHEVVAFGVVDAVLGPALDELVLEERGLLRADIAFILKEPPD